MDYTTGVNNKTLKRNVGEVMKQYDPNGNGYDKKEIKDILKGSVSIFGKPFITNKVISEVQNRFDKNKDGIVSEKEIDSFLKKNYNINLKDAKEMTVKDLANKIQAQDKAKKKK